jgi:hypothetical protein
VYEPSAISRGPGIHYSLKQLFAVVDRWVIGDEFRQFMLHRASAWTHVSCITLLHTDYLRPSLAVITCPGVIIAADSIDVPPNQKSIWTRVSGRMRLFFGRRSTGAIHLPTDDQPLLERHELLGSTLPSRQRSWNPPADVFKNVAHWSRLSTEWNTHKAL